MHLPASSPKTTQYGKLLRATPSDDDARHLEGCDCLKVGPSSGYPRNDKIPVKCIVKVGLLSVGWLSRLNQGPGWGIVARLPGPGNLENYS